MPATVVVPSPSGDPTGVTDSSNIDAAIASAGDGGRIVLDVGNFALARPITTAFLTAFTIEGQHGGINGRSSRLPGGTNIRCGTAFASSGGGAIFDILDGSCNPRICGLAIVGDENMPANVDGIACHSNVNALDLESLSMAFTTGHGVAWFQGADGTDGDACKMRTVMIQNPGMNSVHRFPADSTLIDVHSQYAGTLMLGHGFFTTPGSGGNSSLIGCRADLGSGCGYLLDHNGGFCDAIKLSCCSTERNAQSGVLITNSSPGGTDYRVPVIISGCCFEGDGWGTGQGGEFAGIQVQGRNRVHISGTNVMCNNKDCASVAPKYSLLLNQAGSAPGQAELIEWNSGYMNFSLGQGGEAIHNPSLVTTMKIGTTVTQGGGYQTSTSNERGGVVSTSGLVATVNSPWVRANSRILLTGKNAIAPGSLFITSQSTGTFSIKAGSTDCTVYWQIM
jgi:hypothetical protein